MNVEKATEHKNTLSAESNVYDSWARIYVMPEVETDAATEKEFGILLSDYLQQHDFIHYYLSPDEKAVYAVYKETSRSVIRMYTKPRRATPGTSATRRGSGQRSGAYGGGNFSERQ